MKKHHFILTLLLAGIAAYLLNESRTLKDGEAIASAELKLLREALEKSPEAAASSFSTGKSRRTPAIDVAVFTTGLADILKDGPDLANRQRIKEFLTTYEVQLNSAPLSKLKEICGWLEKEFPLDQANPEGAQLVWFGVVRLAAKSDPAWAFAKLEQAASTTQLPIHVQLGMLKNSHDSDGEPMGLAYAAALQKWLDTLQAAGRTEGTDSLVTELRAEIAAAQGDQSAAVKQISQLPHQTQRNAAVEYLQGLPTPEARRKGIEDLSSVLNFYNFTSAVQSLAARQGFDAAREILGSASLTPEKHDMAAASIAAAEIGPETGSRAAWLLDNLRSDDGRALDLFTSSWTRGNHTEAASWIASMQPGPRRDAALKGFIPVAARVDGATAMDWALTVSDPLLRNQLYCEAHENWKQTDAAQANEYHDTHPLDREAVEAASR